jgi:predicted porin
MTNKLSLLATSISLILSTGAVQAEGPIDGKVYGKVNVSLQSVDEGADSRVTELKSNASRLGFKGTTSLENELTVIYQYEFEVNADDGDKGGKTMTQRNSYVGLKGHFGTVLAGIHDTPLKKAQGKVDLFNDLEGDIKSVFSGEKRESNTVYYKTPSLSGFSADLAFVASEDENDDDGYSLATKFKQDNLYAAFAYDLDIEGEGNETLRLVGQYKLDALTLGAMWNQFKVDGSDDTDGFLISAAYKMGSNTFKLQHASSDIKAEGGTQTSVGIDHKLAKKTKLFGFYTMMDEDASNADTNALGLGIEHKF